MGLAGCRTSSASEAERKPVEQAARPGPVSKPPVTRVQVHNVLFHIDESLVFRVSWLRGRLLPAKTGVIPSFDDKLSMVLEIDSGVMAVSSRDVTRLLNERLFAYAGSPLSKVVVTMQGERLQLRGTLHKGISFPIEMLGDVSATPEGKLRIHAVKLSALHVPVKGLLGAFGVHMNDLIDAKGAKGMTVVENDVVLDLQQIIPPPRQRGRLSAVHVKGDDLVEVFGSPREEVTIAKNWKNFIACEGGEIRFGRLTMHDADLTMIDTSGDRWFDFYLDHYHEQLAAGYVKITEKGAVRAFMPDFNKIPGKRKL